MIDQNRYSFNSKFYYKKSSDKFLAKTLKFEVYWIQVTKDNKENKKLIGNQ